MMIGLSALGTVQPGDICLDTSSGLTAPCLQNLPTFLCMDPNTGQHGPCSQFPANDQVPVLSLADVMQRCNTTNCQIWSAAPQPFATGGPCDPLIMAAGYSCQGSGQWAAYVKQTGSGGNLQNGQLYTPQGVITAPSANQYYLTPQQTGYLIDQGIIAPVQTMNTPLTPNPYAAPPTSGPGASTSVQYAYTQAGQPTANYLPVSSSAPPSAPMTPAASTPTTVVLGAGQQPYNPVTGMPGNGGPSAYAPAGSSTDASGSSTWIPGISNQTVMIAGAALLALVLLKK
jgi:hypothetical protein